MDPFIGMIIQFAGNFAPKGWALCDGTLLAISQNTALFSILGTTYGGNGQTTFALPDLRGRVCIHPGHGPGLSGYDLGQNGGAESVTLTIGNLPAHNHPYLASDQVPSGTTATGNSLGSPTSPIYFEKGAPTVTMNSAVIGSTGSSQPFGNVQPYLAINWIICTEGIYPTRP